jgi:hypothetical protein
MLTPAEGRFLANDLPHGSSTPNLDPSVAQERTAVAPRPTHRGGRRKKKNKKCLVANRTTHSSPLFTPTNSLPKRHRFKQQNVCGPSTRQVHSGAKHSNLYAAKASRSQSTSHQQRNGPYLVRSGPPPKRSHKWQTRLNTKKKNAHHQAPTDTIRDD